MAYASMTIHLLFYIMEEHIRMQSSAQIVMKDNSKMKTFFFSGAYCSAEWMKRLERLC